MNRYDTTDLLLSEEGDFLLDETGDLQLVNKDALIQQMVMVTLKSSNPDWFRETFPADLEDLIGKENSEETGNLGKEKILAGLLRTGFFEKEDIWIDARPVNEMEIMFFVFIRSPFADDPLIYEVQLDLGFGTSVRRVR